MIIVGVSLKELCTIFHNVVIQEKVVANLFGLNVSRNRVWKGNSRGIWDLTKLRCEIREKAKYIEGTRDLTTLREAGFAKIWGWDAGFFFFWSKFWKFSCIKLGKKLQDSGFSKKSEWDCGIHTR